MSTTKNLEIPLLDGDTLVSKECINNALKKVDDEATPIAHTASKAHFELWQKNTSYDRLSVVRTTTCPSWGAFVCQTAGTSGSTEPAAAGAGDTVTDGTVAWKLVQLAGGTAIDQWYSNVLYAAKDFCIYNNNLYRCKAAHTSAATFETPKWQLISGDISDWAAMQSYAEGTVVIYDDKLYRCKTAHISGTAFSDTNWLMLGGSGTAGIAQTYASIADMLADAANVKDGNLVAVISKDKVILYMRDSSIVTGDTIGYIPCGDVTTSTTTDSNTAKPWATNTSYKVNQLVSYQQSLYMCLQAHTSGTFKTDLANDCWKKIDSDQTVIGSASGYSQITKLDVEAASTVPKEVKIPINETKSFCLPPVEVLKFKAGDTNIVVTECEFDNSDSTDFTYNEDLVDFGSTINCAGAMHLLTEKKLATSIPVMSIGGYISVSDELDLTVYKSIDKIKTAKIVAGKV